MEKKEEKSLKRQSAGLLFAKVVGFAFAFMIPLLVVRFLSQDQVGVYRQSFQVVANAMSFLSLGVAMSAFYYLSREAEKRAAAVFNILLFHITTGGLAFFTLYFFPQILGKIFQSAEMTALAPLIGVAIWLGMTSVFLETIAVANQETLLSTVFIICAQLSKTVLIIAAVTYFGSVEAIIHAAIIQGIIQTVVLLAYLNSRFPRFWKTFSFKFLREHLAYALPFGFAGVLWVMQNDLHTYFVGWRFSDAEYAVYAYGCFQIPLIAMLSESVIAVLLPRMSRLQLTDDRREMIRVTGRAMQKLSLFYFPVFVFLMIVSETLVVTLFTRNYLQSVPVFRINLLLLPILIFLSDPIVRSYKELGRFLLALRICMFIVLFTTLYFSINNLSMTGVIAIAVASKFVESVIAEIVVFYKIGAKKSDLHFVKTIGKTAIASILTGAIVFVVYYFSADALGRFGENLARAVFGSIKTGVVNFISGVFTLGIMFAVFAPIFLFFANILGIIEEEEKTILRNAVQKIGSILKRKNEAQNVIANSKL